MKQTAVEWFYQRILAKDIKEVFEQAMQMEKEEILDAWSDGYSCGMYQEGLGIDYYNETYLGIIKEEE